MLIPYLEHAHKASLASHYCLPKCTLPENNRFFWRLAPPIGRQRLAEGTARHQLLTSGWCNKP